MYLFKPAYAIGSVPSLSSHALRTDSVHCRESTGTGSVNLKVVPNGCCLGRSMDQLICASLSQTHYWHVESTVVYNVVQ